MVEGLETNETSHPLQSAYGLGLVVIGGAALYIIGELAVTFPIVGAGVWMVLGFLLPMACVIGVLYSRGNQRVFFIGALFPAAITLSVAVTLFVVMTFDPDKINHFDFSRMCPTIAWFFTLGCGAIATSIANRLAVAEANVAAEERNPDGSTRSIWQFSLWSLMIAMSLCAVLCAMVFVMPPVISVVVCLILWAVAPVVVTTLVIWGGARRRDFGIGAAFPTAAGFAAVTCVFVIVALDDGPRVINDYDVAVGLRVITVMLGAFILLQGKLAAILGHRMRNWQEKQRN